MCEETSDSGQYISFELSQTWTRGLNLQRLFYVCSIYQAIVRLKQTCEHLTAKSKRTKSQLIERIDFRTNSEFLFLQIRTRTTYTTVPAFMISTRLLTSAMCLMATMQKSAGSAHR